MDLVDNSKGKMPYQEKRRRPRLNLTAEQFRLSRNGKIFSVIDLSTDGMALRILDRQDLQIFPIAGAFDGTLNLKGTKLEVRGKVQRLGTDLVGCEFADLSEQVRKQLANFLDPKVLGSELKPIPSSEQGSVWYHGPSGTDLILAIGVDAKYRRITLYVLGYYIDWDRQREQEDGRLTTGVADVSDAQAEIRGVIRFDTMMMRVDAKPDPAKLIIAKEVILSSNLPQDLKNWCARQLSLD